WHCRTAASAADRFHRRTGDAVRLLHSRHPDQRRCAVEAKSASWRPRGSRGARPQPVPLRLAQPHRQGRAARGGRNGSAMTTSRTPQKLPPSLAANPTLSSWIRVSPEGQVVLSPGKVEIGQGIVTALAQIAADELDVDIGRVKMVRASTAGSPNEGVTSGSLSIQQSGRAIRQACAEIRRIFLAAAADRLGVDANALEIDDGMISGPGNVQTSYWELADEISLDRDATLEAAPKAAAKRALAGQSVRRLDIPDKVFARRR